MIFVTRIFCACDSKADFFKEVAIGSYVTANKRLLAVTVTANKGLLAVTVTANKGLLAVTITIKKHRYGLKNDAFWLLFGMDIGLGYS